jgi:hypothetical protein
LLFFYLVYFNLGISSNIQVGASPQLEWWNVEDPPLVGWNLIVVRVPKSAIQNFLMTNITKALSNDLF